MLRFCVTYYVAVKEEFISYEVFDTHRPVSLFYSFYKSIVKSRLTNCIFLHWGFHLNFCLMDEKLQI